MANCKKETRKANGERRTANVKNQRIDYSAVAISEKFPSRIVRGSAVPPVPEVQLQFNL